MIIKMKYDLDIKKWKTTYESAVVHRKKLICFSALITKV